LFREVAALSQRACSVLLPQVSGRLFVRIMRWGGGHSGRRNPRCRGELGIIAGRGAAGDGAMTGSKHSGEVLLKRAYLPAAPEDGTRVLVDRLWPRGLARTKAVVDVWMKDIAPSNELRRWFGHDPERWSEFRRRYKAELAANPEALKQLRSLVRKGRVTLLYGAKDERHNQAVVLEELLRR
jgi:uncharacterized protein YeaO (DUF488 family)